MLRGPAAEHLINQSRDVYPAQILIDYARLNKPSTTQPALFRDLRDLAPAAAVSAVSNYWTVGPC